MTAPATAPAAISPTTRPQATMQAIVQDRYGSAEVLELREIPIPEIDDDQVLIRVRAAGVDAGVWHLMEGVPYAVRLVSGLRTPKVTVRGVDVAGTIEKVGANVTRRGSRDRLQGPRRRRVRRALRPHHRHRRQPVALVAAPAARN